MKPEHLEETEKGFKVTQAGIDELNSSAVTYSGTGTYQVNETPILTLIQEELKAPKNQQGYKNMYRYRSCEDILEAVKPLLKKHGATLTITDTVELIGNRFYVKATCHLWAGEEEAFSVSAYAREVEEKRPMDPAQITGAASSYARKYALNGLFLIDDTKDIDSEKPREEPGKAFKDMLKASGKLQEPASKPALKVPTFDSSLFEWVQWIDLAFKAGQSTAVRALIVETVPDNQAVKDYYTKKLNEGK